MHPYRYVSKEFYPVFGEVPWGALLGHQTASIPPVVAATDGADPATHDVGDAETMVKLITLLVRHEGDKKVEPDDIHAVAASVRLDLFTACLCLARPRLCTTPTLEIVA
jgi:hypothetical protein